MRIVVFFLLFGLMQPALAVTKCEFKRNKTLYKKGTCPKRASTSYLVKDKFVREESLEKTRLERAKLSKQAYKKLITPKKRYRVSEDRVESKPIKPKEIQVPEDNSDRDMQNTEQQHSKNPKINAPKMYDGVNLKLSEMEQKLEAHQKELQQLQTQ